MGKKTGYTDNLNGLTNLLHHSESMLLDGQKEKQVMIEKAVNLRLFCDYAVSCSYLDVVLIIHMLNHYIYLLDNTQDTILWRAYYRRKFQDMQERLCMQIEYDYEEVVKKCKRKQERAQKALEREKGYGEDGITQLVRSGAVNGKKKKPAK